MKYKVKYSRYQDGELLNVDTTVELHKGEKPTAMNVISALVIKFLKKRCRYEDTDLSKSEADKARKMCENIVSYQVEEIIE